MSKVAFCFAKSFVLLCSFCVCFHGRLAVSGEPGVETPVRLVVEKAIPYLKNEGTAWIEDRGCVSCHQVPAMLWSLAAAERNGFDVDGDQLRQWQSWSTQAKSFVAPAQKSDFDVDKTLANNIDTMNALLLAIDDDDTIGETNWRGVFSDALVKNQNPDGSWKACGQLPAQKRPKEETTQVTVLWTLLALAKQNVGSHDSAAAYKVAENPEPASTEWWVARLLLADQTADDRLSALREKLLGLQHDDGGWGWLTEEPSDALATGMVLYALRKTSASTDAADSDSAALRAAAKFLTATQRDDGSWGVPGTKEKTREKSTPTSDYWGTAWAVIGLLE